MPLVLVAAATDAGGSLPGSAVPSTTSPPPATAPAAAPAGSRDATNLYDDLLAVASGAGDPNAPAWLFVPHLTWAEIATDNARHSETNKQSDLISVLGAGLTASANAPQLTGIFTYQALVRRALNVTRRSIISQYGFATAHATLVPDFLYLDVHGKADEIVRGQVQTTNPLLLDSSNTSQIYLLTVSPDAKSRVGDIGILDVRYAFNEFWRDRNTGAIVIPGAVINPLGGTTQNEAHGDFRMQGTLAAPLMSDLTGYASDTSTTRFGTLKKAFSEFINEYQFTRGISGIAGGGYEWLADERFATLTGQGPTFDAGFRLKPNVDSSILLLYGRHDLKTGVSGEIQWVLTPNTTFYGAYTNSISSTQQGLISSNASSRVGPGGPSSGVDFSQNPAIGTLNDPSYAPDYGGDINANSGLPLSDMNFFGAGQNGFFRTKVARATLYSDLDIYTVSIRAYHIELTSLTGSLPAYRQLNGAIASVSTLVSGDVSTTLETGYVSPGLDRAKLLTAAAIANYRINQTLRATLRYDFNRRLAGTAGNGFTANSVTIRLMKTF